jgi:rubrerythrin
MPAPIESIREFYAHALAIERDAAESYRELERVFRVRGALALADLAASLASAEGGHVDEVARRSEEYAVPMIPAGVYKWLGRGSPEALPIEIACKAVSARELLVMAHAAELRSAAFFEHVAANTPDDTVRMLAGEMAREEHEHARWILHAMEAPALRLERERS